MERPSFSARLESVRGLIASLNCLIPKRSNSSRPCAIIATPDELAFRVDLSPSSEATCTLPSSVFEEYNAIKISKFNVRLVTLLDCLQIFGW